MLNMNEFSTQIYTQLQQVPEGSVTTYGDLAKMIGYPSHARQVGYVLKHLPSESILPWHRVINAQGRLSLIGDRGLRQKERLLTEKIEISEDGRIALRHYRWRP